MSIQRGDFMSEDTKNFNSDSLFDWFDVEGDIDDFIFYSQSFEHSEK